MLFPTLNNEYWFITTYVGLYILSPFLNWALRQINRRQHLLLLMVLILLFSVWPALSFLSSGLNIGGMFSVGWFIVLYCIGAYIRKYYVIRKAWLRLLGFYLLFSSALPASKFIFARITQKTSCTFIPEDLFFSYHSVLVLGASVFLFLLFLNLDIRYELPKKVILWLAPATLGVYLIHDNLYVRAWIWPVLAMHQYVPGNYIWLLIPGVVTVIYVGCTVLEKLRAAMFGRITGSRWLDERCRRIEELFSELYGRMKE